MRQDGLTDSLILNMEILFLGKNVFILRRNPGTVEEPPQLPYFWLLDHTTVGISDCEKQVTFI